MQRTQGYSRARSRSQVHGNVTVDKLLIGVALAATLAAAAFSADEIPFDPARGLVEVTVIIDGRVMGRFGIDTGADRLYIDSTFAHRHGLSFVQSPPQRPVVGLEGSGSASMVQVRSLRIGRETLYNLRATSIDLTRIIKDRRLGMPDGLIGHEVLRRFYVTVDYPRRILNLQSGQPGFLERGGGAPAPFVRFTTNRHLILVDVILNDSLSVPMFLDYCASYTALSPSLAIRLGLDTAVNETQTVARMSIGEALRGEDVPVIVADLSQFKQAVKRCSFDGIIGASFLYRHRLTIDYKAERIYVHRD